MPRQLNYANGKPKASLDIVPLAASVYDAALDRLRYVYDRFDHVAVAFSGGKDSTACLQLTLQVAREKGRLPLRVVHWDEEAIPYQTEEYVRRVSRWPDVDLQWLCLPVKHRNACSRQSPWWYPWAPEDREKWVRPLPPEALTAWPGFAPEPPAARLSIPDMAGLLCPPATYGLSAFIMGIRAQESLIRRRAVIRRMHDNYIIENVDATARGNLFKVYPIYDWRTEDVWTAPQVYDWDYNRAYDVLDKAGLAASRQRCSPAFGEEPLEKLWTYQTCFPELWDRMLERVPGVPAAARYATTELWGYRTKLEKPADMSWEELIAHYIAKFDPASQRFIATAIRSLINEHYGKTSDPILPTAPHPETGVSWEYLVMKAQRGDFKNRKQTGGNIDTRQIEKHRAEYNAERAALEGRIPDAAE